MNGITNEAYKDLCNWEMSIPEDDPFWTIPTTNPEVRCCTNWPECTHVYYWWEKNRSRILGLPNA